MFDSTIFQAINNLVFQNLWLDILSIFLAKYLPYFLVAILLVFLIKNFRKYWRMVLEAGIASVLSRYVLVEILRLLIYRPRPFLNPGTKSLLTYSASSSFPSGHAAVFFAISAIIFLYNKKAGIAFFIASFLMGVARIATGLHWPLDILVGMVVGIIAALLVHKIDLLINKPVKPSLEES